MHTREAPRYVSYRHRWVVVKKDRCPWCEKVQELLALHGKSFAIIDITNRPDEREKLKAAGITTVPQVYYRGDRIGGFEEVQKYLKAEEETLG